MSYTDISMIDPRLVEYLNKKIYFSKNKIIPKIPLETEYAITRDDIRKIKRYLLQTKGTIPTFGETSQFPVYPPNIQYKTRLHHEHIENCGKYNNLRHKPNAEKILKYTKDNTDPPAFLYRIIRPISSERVYEDKYPNECINTIRDQYINNKELDADIMNDMILGMPSHTRKSYGYNDSFEHSFDYIDEDIQTPDHVVLPFPRGGISARLENKKPIKRDIAE